LSDHRKFSFRSPQGKCSPRAALSHDAAIAELHESAGTHFDPTVAEALARFAKRNR
jgi:HD-GYP domain-containing protein (c-di-GMP phosphodiesterase class II)